VQANSRWPKTETVKNSTGTGSDWKNFPSTAHTDRDTVALIYTIAIPLRMPKI
jgi:hypothetical protein